jgi:hypothetical protein
VAPGLKRLTGAILPSFHNFFDSFSWRFELEAQIRVALVVMSSLIDVEDGLLNFFWN